MQSSLAVALDDALHDRVSIGQEVSSVRSLIVEPDAVDQKQGCVDGIIAWRLPSFREEVWHQTALFIFQEGSEDALRGVILPIGQRTARQGNHGVSAPVCEKRIAGYNGLAARGIAAGDVGVCADCQLSGDGIP